ncbi:DUF4391 domain-containing protein [Sporolactobacillus terrae]|uniref:DUF4391 domain-containing protein n=1 Tax=Sporolactobacillus terrae TaxID=269673 RepID=UPI0011189B99|nr:DUF4391 domain-containing protein [Sporolactobacillus terrae]
MDASLILKQFQIPRNCLINRLVPKKVLYEHVSPKQRKIVQVGLNKLRWMYALRTDNTNILAYRDASCAYPVVEYFIAEIEDAQAVRELALILMQAILHPMLLFFTWGDSLQLITADYRTNQADPSKLVVEKLIQSHIYDSGDDLHAFIQKQTFHRQSLTNFKAYYESVVSNMLREKMEIRYSIKLPKTINPVMLDEQLNQIEREAEELQSRIKKADQFNIRVSLQMRLHDLKIQKQNVLKQYEQQE